MLSNKREFDSIYFKRKLNRHMFYAYKKETSIKLKLVCNDSWKTIYLFIVYHALTGLLNFVGEKVYEKLELSFCRDRETVPANLQQTVSFITEFIVIL